MRTKILILLIISVVLTGLNGCGYLSKKYTKSKSEEFTVSSTGKKKLTLENISGDITIRKGSDSSDIEIRVKKEIKVKKKDLDTPFNEIEIKIESEGDEINISSDINVIKGRKFFSFGKGNKANVEYSITLPPGIDLKIDNVDGDVSFYNLENDVNLNLVNGKVNMDNYSGIIQCEIINGSFNAEIQDTKGVNISTVNGSVKLELNNFINAKINAETVNGKISETNLQLREIESEKRSFKGIMGPENPDTEISINTVNGKISLSGKSEI